MTKLTLLEFNGFLNEMLLNNTHNLAHFVNGSILSKLLKLPAYSGFVINVYIKMLTTSVTIPQSQHNLIWVFVTRSVSLDEKIMSLMVRLILESIAFTYISYRLKNQKDYEALFKEISTLSSFIPARYANVFKKIANLSILHLQSTKVPCCAAKAIQINNFLIPTHKPKWLMANNSALKVFNLFSFNPQLALRKTIDKKTRLSESLRDGSHSDAKPSF